MCSNILINIADNINKFYIIEYIKKKYLKTNLIY